LAVVRVTNLTTGRVARARMNDRGPYVGHRILDVSAAIGKALNLREDGAAQVRIEETPSDQIHQPREGRWWATAYLDAERGLVLGSRLLDRA
jgi:rare lipoprotein A